MGIVYKIVPADLWQSAEKTGTFAGAMIDVQDGYIHFSTGRQAPRTAELYFAGQPDLLLVAADDTVLGDALIYEPSRDGDLFPHLYAPLRLADTLWVRPLPLGADGRHVFPEDMA